MLSDRNEMNNRLIKLAESPTSRFWRVNTMYCPPPSVFFSTSGNSKARSTMAALTNISLTAVAGLSPMSLQPFTRSVHLQWRR